MKYIHLNCCIWSKGWKHWLIERQIIVVMRRQIRNYMLICANTCHTHHTQTNSLLTSLRVLIDQVKTSHILKGRQIAHVIYHDMEILHFISSLFYLAWNICSPDNTQAYCYIQDRPWVKYDYNCLCFRNKRKLLEV